MRQSVLVRVNPNRDGRRRKAIDMKLISGDIYGLLVSQGIANGRSAIRDVRGIGAGLPVRDQTDPLTARPGEDQEPMGISGKGRGAKAPPVRQEVGKHNAKEPSSARGGPVLFLVVSNKDVRRQNPTSIAPLGLRTSLVLVK